MDTSKNEQDFVFRYFQSGKLNTRGALNKVKARAGLKVNGGKARFRWIAVAASVAVLLVVGAYALLQPKTIVLQAAAQVASYRLPDGSQVTLSPYSSLSYREDDCRKVEMTGRIYYQVKHDERHPFNVEGEHGHVRVLGTQFMVDERTDAPEVMVTSGKVFFSVRGAKEGVYLTRGKRARLPQGTGKPELLEKYDVNEVAWATHRLHFDNTPISDVLERLSQLSGTRYEASDETKRLTGDFDADSIPQVIQVIEETLGIRIVSSK